MKRRDFLRMAALCGGATALDWHVFGSILDAKEIYPANRITWISHTQPGSGYDIIPRAISPFLTKYLREAAPGCKGGGVVLKNEPAAAGKKAYTAVFRAKPDGYTIGGFSISFVTENIMGKSEFDVGEYTYLAKLDSPNKLVVSGKNGFKSWGEVMEASRKGNLKIGVGQFGRGNHIAGIILKEAFGLNCKFINAQSTSGNMGMLIRGDVQLALASEDSVSSLLESKEIRALLSFEENHELPGAVSMKDLGQEKYALYGPSHRFVIAPPGLPRDISARLIEALKETLADKEFREWAKKAGFSFSPVYGGAATEMAKKYINFFHSMEGTFKKYLL